jgi:hypothetical protein
MKLKQLLQFGIPNSALRIIIFTFLITHSAFLINGCFLTAKYNHPMDGIGGIILNAVLLNKISLLFLIHPIQQTESLASQFRTMI